MGLTPARWLAVLIATGIGLHNFAEGLAIGQSAASGRAAARARADHRLRPPQRDRGLRHRRAAHGRAALPSWRFLLLLGLIGGGPTFVGTLVGQAWVSTSLSILFLALAAGSILYVVMQLLTICRTFGHATLVAWGITVGLVLGFATDFILVGARRSNPPRARRWPHRGPLRLRLPARHRPRARPAVHLRGRGRRREGRGRARPLRRPARAGRRRRGLRRGAGGDRRAARRGGRRPAPAGARRPRALARRLLRLDAGRALALVAPERRSGGPSGRSRPSARRSAARPRRPS